MAWMRTVEKTFIKHLRATGQMGDAFQGWKKDRPALKEFKSVEELVRFCRNPNEDLLEEKNRAIAAVCAEAVEGDDEAELLLIWLFIGVFRKILRKIGPSPLSRDELESEMLAAFLEEVAVAAGDEEKLSGRLFYAVKHRAWEAIREKRAELSRRADFNLEPAVVC